MGSAYQQSNKLGRTTATDIISGIGSTITELSFDGTSNSIPNPTYVILPEDSINLTDSVTITGFGGGGGGTNIPESDSVDVSDSAPEYNANKGRWQVPYDAANSTSIANPIRGVNLFDLWD